MANHPIANLPPPWNRWPESWKVVAREWISEVPPREVLKVFRDLELLAYDQTGVAGTFPCPFPGALRKAAS